jgi:hypothetical protein
MGDQDHLRRLNSWFKFMKLCGKENEIMYAGWTKRETKINVITLQEMHKINAQLRYRNCPATCFYLRNYLIDLEETW